MLPQAPTTTTTTTTTISRDFVKLFVWSKNAAGEGTEEKINRIQKSKGSVPLGTNHLIPLKAACGLFWPLCSS
jgi:hypothetical protein